MAAKRWFDPFPKWVIRKLDPWVNLKGSSDSRWEFTAILLALSLFFFGGVLGVALLPPKTPLYAPVGGHTVQVVLLVWLFLGLGIVFLLLFFMFASFFRRSKVQGVDLDDIGKKLDELPDRLAEKLVPALVTALKESGVVAVSQSTDKGEPDGK